MPHFKQVYIDDYCMVEKLYEADTFFSRLLGLFALKKLKAGEGLSISPCSSVHTFFMSYSIMVIFLSKENVVLKVEQCLKPFRFAYCLKAYSVIELLSDAASKEITTGQKIRFISK